MINFHSNEEDNHSNDGEGHPNGDDNHSNEVMNTETLVEYIGLEDYTSEQRGLLHESSGHQSYHLCILSGLTLDNPMIDLEN